MQGEAIAALKSLLGEEGYVDQVADMQPYLISMRNRQTARSPLVVKPATTDEVAEVVRICRYHQIALVPQGGNTGLVDGGIPSAGGGEIVLNLSRMNKVRDLDPVGAIVTVEAGVVLQTLQDVAAAAGFLFPLSLASEGSAEVGGLISTNAGGTAVLRYGTMRQLVLGLEVVRYDGTVLSSLRKLVKDNTGYNLNHLYIGAEGTLGVITAATLKLFPRQKQILTSVFAVESVIKALELFAVFRREAGEFLAAFEIMSQASLRLVTKRIVGTRFPGKDNAPFYALIELTSSSADLPLRAFFEKVASVALSEGMALDAVVAGSEAQSQSFWHLRENIPTALRAESQRIHFDISLPLERMVGFMEMAEQKILARAPDMILMPFGHMGDGNLHYNMYAVSSRLADEFQGLKKEIQALVFDLVDQWGGSISAEHGIGVERKAALAAFKSPVELETMRALKQTLDPERLFNPGKIFD